MLLLSFVSFVLLIGLGFFTLLVLALFLMPFAVLAFGIIKGLPLMQTATFKPLRLFSRS